MKKRNLSFADRVIEDAVYEYGIELFGDEKDFWRWMNCEMMALGGMRPRDLTLAELIEELERFEEGSY